MERDCDPGIGIAGKIHIMNEAQTDTLRGSREQSLETSCDDEGNVIGCKSRE
jgi:hypothetical protein